MPTYKKSDIEKYYEILGVSGREGLKCPDFIRLDNLEELFELNHLNDCGDWLNNPDTYIDEELVSSMKNLSTAYGLLHSIIFHGFIYETEEQKQNAYDSAMAILEDLSQIDVSVPDDETKSAVRRNNLKASILSGLSCVDDIIRFRLYQQNTGFNSIYYKISDIEADELHCEQSKIEYDKTPDVLMKLYYLMAYSKFVKNDSEFEMFDIQNQVDLKKLRSLVRRNLSEGVAMKDDETPGKPAGRILRMSHFAWTRHNSLNGDEDKI